MQIVIDIPIDTHYHARKRNVSESDIKIILEAISKGVPLFKGHGRLGDLSKIYVELNEAQIEGAEEYKGLGEAKQIVCNAPTIIEADKTERSE